MKQYPKRLQWFFMIYLVIYTIRKAFLVLFAIWNYMENGYYRNIGNDNTTNAVIVGCLIFILYEIINVIFIYGIAIITILYYILIIILNIYCQLIQLTNEFVSLMLNDNSNDDYTSIHTKLNEIERIYDNIRNKWMHFWNNNNAKNSLHKYIIQWILFFYCAAILSTLWLGLTLYNLNEINGSTVRLSYSIIILLPFSIVIYFAIQSESTFHL